MNPQKNPSIDPMREGHPEPFREPRTIPSAWDVTEWISGHEHDPAEMNGTAFNQTNPTFSAPYDNSKNTVR